MLGIQSREINVIPTIYDTQFLHSLGTYTYKLTLLINRSIISIYLEYASFYEGQFQISLDRQKKQ